MLSPKVRRFLSGARLDVLSLPQRLRDPRRRAEPWQWRHNIGGGDYLQAGREFLDQLVRYGGLTTGSDVLDIGCGTGRIAMALASYLDVDSRYTGFDVSQTAIIGCRKRFRAIRPDFTFVHADVRNGEYRPTAISEEFDYVFPSKDASVDVVFAFSVFSHMRIDPIRRYISEANRVLRPGGRLLFTAYLLTPERIAALGRGEGSRRFEPWQSGAMVMDPKSPERAIAHPMEVVQEALVVSTFQVDDVRLGAWIGSPQYEGGQDMIVASHASHGGDLDRLYRPRTAVRTVRFRA